MGRIVTEEKGEYGLVQSGLQPLNLTNIKKSKVASKKGSKISMMPGGLINSMNKTPWHHRYFGSFFGCHF